MGEITEALRRARLQRRAAREAAERVEEPAASSTAARAGIDALPPAEAAPPAPPRKPDPPEVVPRAGARPAAAGGAVRLSTVRDALWPARAVMLDPRQPHTERIRRFAVRVAAELEERARGARGQTVLVTSSLRSEGKTFTSCNLALALADMAAGQRVALVELDARRPSIGAALGVHAAVGFEEVLAGRASLSDARTVTDVPALDLFLVREPPSRPHEILERGALDRIFGELREQYQVVVVDSPPVLLVPDVNLLLPHISACVAVVRAGTSRVKAVRDMLEQIPPDKLIGIFVNDVSAPRESGLYTYYAVDEEGAR